MQRPRRSERYVPTSSGQAGRGSGRQSARRGTLEEARNLPVHRQRRKESRRRTAIVVLAAIAVVLLGVSAYVWSYLQNLNDAMRPDQETLDLVERITDQPAGPDEPFTILLLGDDSRPGETMARSDTIMVARVDPAAGQVWLLSIPRDTRVVITGYGEQKINAATRYGGPALAIEAVEELLGIQINYYMTVNFTGFVEVVDALGGVYVNVETEIDDPKAATHSDDPSAAHIDAGYQLLDGVHALTFVRTRDYVDADFGRMRNQQVFFKALAEQVKSVGNAIKIPGMVTAMAEHIETNMDVTDLIRTALALRDSGSENIYTATVEGEWDSPFVWPNEELMADLIQRMQSGVSFDGTSTVASPVIDASDVTVTVRNGARTQISGAASAAASVLSGAGFVVSDIGNAGQFVYDRTLIIYDEDSADGLMKAQAVSAAMPIGDMVASSGMYSFSSDVLVVVGSDWSTVTDSD